MSERLELGPEADACKLLPPAKDDGSGVGINYADAYLKGFKTILDDGRKVLCKRRGLKITLTIGDRKGEALLRRLEHGPDEKTIVQRAIAEAAKDAGATFTVENDRLVLVLDA